MDTAEDRREPAPPPSRRGRRRLNAPMHAAQDELGLPPPATPSKRDLLNVLKSLRGTLPVSRAAAATLIVMIEKTRPEDWEALATPFIYAHNTTLMTWTGLSRTTLQRHVRELGEAKMLVAQDGRNGQRGRRWQGSDGETRVGFNLASMRYRWTELLALLDEARRHRQRISFLRAAIADLNEPVRAGAEQAGLNDIVEQARRIMRSRLRTSAIDRLEGYHEAMAELLRAVNESRASQPVENCAAPDACTEKMGPMGPGFGAHYTDTKNNQSFKKVVPVAADGRDRIEAMRPAKALLPHAPPDGTDRSALRGFKGTALFYLEICSALRAFCTSARPTADELVLGAEYLSGQIGVSYHAWAQGCTVLGRFQAAIAVIVMAARLERGAIIHRPDAYLRALIERGCRSQLYLDRSLYALRDARTRETETTVRTQSANSPRSRRAGPELQTHNG